MKRIILGYSGSLATTVAIRWLAEAQAAEVVAVTLDLGHGEELEAIRDRALAAGAVRAHVLDVRDAYARDYLVPALRAGALQSSVRLGALAHPLIAKTLVEIAAIEQAGIVAHGAIGAAERRLAAAIAALGPALLVVAPACQWSLTPAAQAEYARLRNVSYEAAPAAPQIKPPAECPDEAAYVDVRFDRGIATALNHIEMTLADVVPTLSTIAGAHGVAAPAAIVLQAAHDELQKASAHPDVDRFARVVRGEYEGIIDAGGWFGPFRRTLDGFIAAAQDNVTGVVRLKLFKGVVESAARQEAPAPKPWPLVAVRTQN